MYAFLADPVRVAPMITSPIEPAAVSMKVALFVPVPNKGMDAGITVPPALPVMTGVSVSIKSAGRGGKVKVMGTMLLMKRNCGMVNWREP